MDIGFYFLIWVAVSVSGTILMLLADTDQGDLEGETFLVVILLVTSPIFFPYHVYEFFKMVII